MSETNGWTKFEKSGSSGYLYKYQNRIVVILSKTKGNNKTMYLPDAVLKALGKPTHVDIMTRGSNAAIVASYDKTGFKVLRSPKSNMSSISCVAFSATYNLKSGVYDAHIESGKIVFDMEQAPAKT